MKGKDQCRGCYVPACKLDDAVLGALEGRLFTPGHLGEILRMLLKRQIRNDADVAGRVADLKAAVADAAAGLKRLYRLVEDGTAEVDDVLEDRLRMLRAEKAEAEAALGRAGTRSGAACVVGEASLERFSQLMRDKINHGDVNARCAYIASVASAIEVDMTVPHRPTAGRAPGARPTAGRRCFRFRTRMARLDGATSNELFEVLTEWNTLLGRRRIDEPKAKINHGPQP